MEFSNGVERAAGGDWVMSGVEWVFSVIEMELVGGAGRWEGESGCGLQGIMYASCLN